MSDAALFWYNFGADIQVVNGDLFPDNGLASAVLISLFTDARAPDEKLLPDGEVSLRGWWGDLDNRETTGSLLWLIHREKTVPDVAARAREYCTEALQWLKDEEIAESYTVETQLVKPQSLQIKIKIKRGAARRYSYLWDAVKEYPAVAVQNTSVQIEFID